MVTQHTVTVFNTCTSQYEEVSVSEDIYNEYRRSEWRVQKNEAKHRVRETPFSALIGGEDGSYENFHEFASEKELSRALLSADLQRAMAHLSGDEQKLIWSMFFYGMTLRQYAEKFHVPLMTAQDRKVRILKKIKKFLE